MGRKLVAPKLQLSTTPSRIPAGHSSEEAHETTQDPSFFSQDTEARMLAALKSEPAKMGLCTEEGQRAEVQAVGLS